MPLDKTRITNHLPCPENNFTTSELSEAFIGKAGSYSWALRTHYNPFTHLTCLTPLTRLTVVMLLLLLTGCAHLTPPSDNSRDTSRNYLSQSAREIAAPHGSADNPE